MRFPSECCQIHRAPRQRMPHLSEAQPRGLDLWTFGTITAQSGRRNSVIASLNFTGGFSAVRRRLREWLYYGADRSTPSPNRIDVRARFAPLMRWALSLRKSNDLALARRSDYALRQVARHRSERGLSGMRHPGRLGRHARQHTGQANRTRRRAANRRLSPFP